MDTIIISSEKNILHVFIDEEHVDYTLYNNHGHNLDGGVLDLESHENTGKIVNEIIEILKDSFSFSEPYILPSKEDTQEIIERVEEEDYQNMISKVEELSSEKKEIELEKE